MTHAPSSLAPPDAPAGTTPEVLLERAHWLLYLDGLQAGALGRQVLAMTSDDPSHPARGLAWWHVAFSERRFGDPARATEAIGEARAAFARAGDERGLLLCDDYQTLHLRAQGQVDEALALHLRIAARTDVARPPDDLYLSHNQRAITRKVMGEIDEMVRDFYLAEAAARQSASPGPRINALVNLGGCHVDLYNLEDALTLSRQAMDQAEAAAAWPAFTVAAFNVIQVLDGRGDGPGCAEVLARLLRRAPQLPPGMLERDAPCIAMAHLTMGDLAGAQAWLDRGATAGIGDGDGRSQHARVLAAWLIATGRPDEARRVVEARLAADDEDDHVRDQPYIRMRLLQVATEACERLGDGTAALRYLRAAHALYETLASRGSQARFVAMQVAHEAEAARADRDRARLAHEASERDRERLASLNQALEERIAETQRLNAALHQKMAEAESLQRQLHEQAVHDPLTGLYNRRFLSEAAAPRLHLAQRQGTTLSLVLIDIDHFKQVNDRHGHEVGDEVLVGFAQLLTRRLRRSDIVCRFGGEEFLLLVDPCDEDGLRVVLERLQDEFRALAFGHADRPLAGCTFSAGVATLGVDADGFEALVRVADGRMYRAKDAGRARVWTRHDG